MVTQLLRHLACEGEVGRGRQHRGEEEVQMGWDQPQRHGGFYEEQEVMG